MGLLNDEGDRLARRIQTGLARAGMKDVALLSVQLTSGRCLILRHGPMQYRVRIYPYQGCPASPEEEEGWLPILVSTAFDDTTVRELADADANFLDESGNAHLSLNGQTVLFARADARGRTSARVPDASRPQRQAKRAAGVLSLNRASHQVAFALLCAPDLAGKSVRTLAAVANVSLGTVHNTLTALTEAGHLLDGRLHNTSRLLDAWAGAYRRLTFTPLSPRPLYAPAADWVDKLRHDPTGKILLGGAAAAGLLASQLRATDGIAYASDVGYVVKLLHLSPAPTPFSVELRERFWGEGLPSSQPGLVPSVLVYGDLLRDGDARALEAATYLREHDAHLRALV